MTYDLNALSPTLRRWIRTSGVPKQTLGKTLGDLGPFVKDEVLRGRVTRWLAALEGGTILRADGVSSSGHGLLLIGSPGVGKSLLASVILQQAAKLEVFRTVPAPSQPIRFMYYPEVLEIAKKAMGNDEAASALMDALFGRTTAKEQIAVLVIDDLGKEHRTSSKWAENMFDHLLRSRHNKGLPTIITSNIPLANWAVEYGASMESFAHEALTPLPIASPTGDRRKN